MRVLTEELRVMLRRPLGMLVDENALIEIVKRTKGKVVSVGDESSFCLIKNGVKPNIVIYDLKCMRKPVSQNVKRALEGFKAPEKKVKNPPGTISEELLLVVRSVMKDGRGKVFVEGEEDLSALVAMMYAEDGDLIIYGQPGEGVVVIPTTPSSREKAKRIFYSMKLEFK